jgi:hypothetical protein
LAVDGPFWIEIPREWRGSRRRLAGFIAEHQNANNYRHNFMSTLANTTWNLEQDDMPSNITITLKFGPNQAPPNQSGGPGTMTIIVTVRQSRQAGRA